MPAFTFAMSLVFAAGMFQTLASYVSTHTGPTLTASGGHVETGAAPELLGTASTETSTPVIKIVRNGFIESPHLSVLRSVGRRCSAQTGGPLGLRLPRGAGRQPCRVMRGARQPPIAVAVNRLTEYARPSASVKQNRLWSS